MRFPFNIVQETKNLEVKERHFLEFVHILYSKQLFIVKIKTPLGI